MDKLGFSTMLAPGDMSVYIPLWISISVISARTTTAYVLPIKCQPKPLNSLIVMDIGGSVDPNVEFREARKAVFDLERILPQRSLLTVVTVDGKVSKLVGNFRKTMTSEESFQHQLYLFNEMTGPNSTLESLFNRSSNADVVFILANKGVILDSHLWLSMYINYVIQVNDEPTTWDILASDQQHLVSLNRLRKDRPELLAVICADSHYVCATDSYKDVYNTSPEPECNSCLIAGCSPGSHDKHCTDVCKYFREALSISVSTTSASEVPKTAADIAKTDSAAAAAASKTTSATATPEAGDMATIDQGVDHKYIIVAVGIAMMLILPSMYCLLGWCIGKKKEEFTREMCAYKYSGVQETQHPGTVADELELTSTSRKEIKEDAQADDDDIVAAEVASDDEEAEEDEVEKEEEDDDEVADEGTGMRPERHPDKPPDNPETNVAIKIVAEENDAALATPMVDLGQEKRACDI